MTHLPRAHSKMDLQALINGLAFVCVVYGGLAVYAFIAGPRHLAFLQEKVAPSMTVPVQKKGNLPIVLPDLTIPQSVTATTQKRKTPFEAFRLPSPKAIEGKGQIALLVLDFGLSQSASTMALQTLPEGTGVVLSPYATDILVWGDKARKAKKEIWLELPIAGRETAHDVGPLALTLSMMPKDALTALDKVLKTGAEYAGIAANLGSGVPIDAPAVSVALDDIFAKGLGFMRLNPLESTESAGADPFAALALSRGAPYVRVESVLAPETPQDLPLFLEQVERKLAKGEHILIAIPPWPILLTHLGTWTQTFKMREDVVFVSPSALAFLPQTEEAKDANGH